MLLSLCRAKMDAEAMAPVPIPKDDAPPPPRADSPPPTLPLPRRSSVASTSTISPPGSSSLISGNLILSSLEAIAASREGSKAKPLKQALELALDALKNPLPPASVGSSGTVDPHLIFAPLRLACETKSLPLMILALDCIGKLVSYDFFIDTAPPRHVQETNDDGEVPPVEQGETLPLADLVTNTVCDCFSPSPSSTATTTHPTTQHDTLLLRLLSCLLSLILSSALSVHQSALLKAVRTVYNVFLLGSTGTVQTVAQATLGQIVGGVFGRVSLGEAATNGASHHGTGPPTPSRATFSNRSGNTSAAESKTDLGSVAEDEDDAVPVKEEVAVDQVVEPVEPQDPVEGEEVAHESATDDDSVSIEKDPSEEPVTLCVTSLILCECCADASSCRASIESRKSFEGVPDRGPLLYISTNDLYIKDAFLVFRALCKLSMKPLGADRCVTSFRRFERTLIHCVVNEISSRTLCVRSCCRSTSSSASSITISTCLSTPPSSFIPPLPASVLPSSKPSSSTSASPFPETPSLPSSRSLSSAAKSFGGFSAECGQS